METTSEKQVFRENNFAKIFGILLYHRSYIIPGLVTPSEWRRHVFITHCRLWRFIALPIMVNVIIYAVHRASSLVEISHDEHRNGDFS